MSSQRSFVRTIFPTLLLLMIFSALIAQATIMQRLEIEELTRKSTDVFYGQVMATQTYWNADHTRIYTGVQVRVFESFKGAARNGETVKVVQLGGEKDGFKMDYAGRPEFTTGESIVLFTTRNRQNELTVVGLKQGKLPVNGQTVTREFSGLMLLERSKSGKDLQPAKPASTQLSLSELRRRIASVK